jgi:polyisoprenoid-binding protein YceI
MKKLIFILLFQSLYAQSFVDFDLSKSFISYDGKHPAHNWTGVSKDIQGTFEINKQDLTQSKVDLFVPVFSFDSKNANRDSNMLDVVEEYYYPFVRFTSSKINKTENGFKVTGNLSFHGIIKELTIPVNLEEDNQTVIVTSDFSIMLSDFKIKRPALLTIKIRNQVDLKVYLVGSINNKK